MQTFCLIYMVGKASQHKNPRSDALASRRWFPCSPQYQIGISDAYFSWVAAYMASLPGRASPDSPASALSYSSCSAR